MEKLKYPIGRFEKPGLYSQQQLDAWIQDIELFPALLKNETSSLSGAELLYKYRPEGWNILQVIHHCADSHINSFIRFKLALTEDKPTIKPYHEAQWAEMSDSLEASIENSLLILQGLHRRWAIMLKAMQEKDFSRLFIHPEKGKEVSLWENTGMYSWHCKHHLEHIRVAKKDKY